MIISNGEIFFDNEYLINSLIDIRNNNIFKEEMVLWMKEKIAYLDNTIVESTIYQDNIDMNKVKELYLYVVNKYFNI